MLRAIQQFRAALATGPNRIALTTALRGTIATVVPLAVLPLVGLEASARLAVIGALNTSMVDVGGTYRQRLAVMALNAVVSPLLLLAGMATAERWWLAAPVMFAAAFAAGLVRTLGAGFIPLGLNTSIAILVGIQLAEGGAAPRLAWAVAYLGGALWTIAVALAFWRVRPYRRLEQEVASAWQAVADLVAAVRPQDQAGVVARRQQEQRIAERHRLARDAIERARQALGEIREEIYGPGAALAALLVLVRAASRIAAAAVTIGELSPGAAVPDPAARAVLAAALDTLERACREAARRLLAGRGDFAVEPMRRQLTALAALPADAAVAARRHAGILALAQALRHLDNAEEAIRLLSGPGSHRLAPALRPLPGGASLRQSVATPLRLQLTWRSAIFRHALRVAAVAALGTAAIVHWRVPHGIWGPMTALIVLQPDYGATWSRALERTAGTMGGAVLAGILVSTLHGSAAFEAMIALLLFATFLLIRRRYGVAIVFLTPLIILLLGLGGPDPWRDIRDRLLDTMAGAGLAIIAGYLLWPQWERERLPDRFARAIRADAAYLAAVLEVLAGGAVATPLGDLRREAEIETGNAGAAFQRMLGEPRRQRGPLARGFALATYIQRLARHTVALAAHRDTAPLAGAVRLLKERLAAGLEDVAAAVAAGRPPQPRPDFDEPLGAVRQALAARQDAEGDAVAFLLGQIVSDTTSLHAAAAPA